MSALVGECKTFAFLGPIGHISNQALKVQEKWCLQRAVLGGMVDLVGIPPGGSFLWTEDSLYHPENNFGHIHEHEVAP